MVVSKCVFCVRLNDRVIESRALRTMLEADELDSNPVFLALQVTTDRRMGQKHPRPHSTVDLSIYVAPS